MYKKGEREAKKKKEQGRVYPCPRETRECSSLSCSPSFCPTSLLCAAFHSVPKWNTKICACARTEETRSLFSGTGESESGAQATLPVWQKFLFSETWHKKKNPIFYFFTKMWKRTSSVFRKLYQLLIPRAQFRIEPLFANVPISNFHLVHDERPLLLDFLFWYEKSMFHLWCAKVVKVYKMVPFCSL